MTTEHMPTGGNVQRLQTEHISLDPAGWKHHLQIIPLRGVVFLYKLLCLTYMEVGDVLPIQGLVDR